MLNNALRSKIGLKPILASWRVLNVEGIRDTLYVSEENVIEKAIWVDEKKGTYNEIELNIRLNDEGRVILKTGKTRKMSASYYYSHNPKGIVVKVGREYIRIVNEANKRVLVNEYDPNFASLTEVFAFLDEYLDDTDAYMKEHLDLFKHAKKTTRLKIRSGDIFRVPLKGKKFAYGRVISPLRQIIQKEVPIYGSRLGDSMFKIQSVFDPDPFSIPLWVNFYVLKTDNPFMTAEDLTEYAVSSSIVIGDFHLRHSEYKIIGHTNIDLEDLDVPMRFQTKYYLMPLGHYFSWGAGAVRMAVSEELEELWQKNIAEHSHDPDKKTTVYHMIELLLDSSKEGKPQFLCLCEPEDLRDVRLEGLRKKVFELLDLEEGIGYDDFARKYGFITKREIVEMNVGNVWKKRK